MKVACFALKTGSASGSGESKIKFSTNNVTSAPALGKEFSSRQDHDLSLNRTIKVSGDIESRVIFKPHAFGELLTQRVLYSSRLAHISL